MIVLMKSQGRFVLLALIAIAVPLFADSPEVQVGDTVPSPAPDHRYGSAAATDGTDFFVVWSDTRTPGRATIMGTRVNRGGQVLDPFGIRITSVPAGLWWPTVVWDGAAYVVAWMQGPYFAERVQRDEVWTTRVDRDGRILTAPRLIAEDALNASGVYAASNGSVTVMAYRQLYNAGSVMLAVLDREGNVIHREFLASQSIDFLRGISVAATATRFVVTWGTRDSKLFAVALDSDGHTIGAPAEIGTGEDPVIATDGTSFTVVWRRWLADVSEWALMSRTVDAELTQFGDVQTLASDQVIEWPSLLWRGDRYEVIAGHQPATQHTYGLLSVELDREGGKHVSSRRGAPLFHWAVPQPVAVTNGSDVLVAYKHPSSHTNQMVARLYRGSSPDPDVQQLLSWSGNAHERPAITSSASGHLAAWLENASIYTTRIDANGNSLDGRGVEITKTGFVVRMAFDGTNYVVAWLDVNFIGIRWIAPATGATVTEVKVPAEALPWDGFGLAVSPDAAYLAWIDERVRVTRVLPEWGASDFPLAVSPVGMKAGHPAIAWNGSMLLVAWNEIGIPVPPGDLPNTRAMNVQAARVSTGLSLLDPALMIVATAGAFSLGAPSIASNGEDWLVVTDLDDQHLLARRVLRSGNVEGTGASKISDGAAPAVTWDGTRYAIAYKTGASVQQPEHPLLLGALPATGALRLTSRTLVSTDVVSPPSIARTASGNFAIIYTKVSFRPEHMGVERSYFRVLDYGARGRVVRH